MAENPVRCSEACLALFELTGPVKTCHAEAGRPEQPKKSARSGGDAQAGMSAVLTCDTAGRIVAQRLEYGGDAVGDGERPAEFSYDDAGRLTRTHANPGP